MNDILGGDDLVEWGSRLWETKLEDGLTLAAGCFPATAAAKRNAVATMAAAVRTWFKAVHPAESARSADP